MIAPFSSFDVRLEHLEPSGLAVFHRSEFFGQHRPVRYHVGIEMAVVWKGFSVAIDRVETAADRGRVEAYQATSSRDPLICDPIYEAATLTPEKRTEFTAEIWSMMGSDRVTWAEDVQDATMNEVVHVVMVGDETARLARRAFEDGCRYRRQIDSEDSWHRPTADGKRLRNSYIPCSEWLWHYASPNIDH